MPSKIFSFPGLATVIALITGCAGPSVVPEDNYYRLINIEPDTRHAGALLDGVVAVESLEADAVYNERAVLYSDIDQPLQLQRYHYHYWSDRPPRMLQRQLGIYLKDANLARQVVDSRGFDGDVDFRVGGVIRQFEELKAGDEVRAKISLELQLTRESDGAVIFSEQFVHISGPVKDDQVYIAVELFQDALSRIFDQFLAALDSALSSRAGLSLD